MIKATVLKWLGQDLNTGLTPKLASFCVPRSSVGHLSSPSVTPDYSSRFSSENTRVFNHFFLEHLYMFGAFCSFSYPTNPKNNHIK